MSEPRLPLPGHCPMTADLPEGNTRCVKPRGHRGGHQYESTAPASPPATGKTVGTIGNKEHGPSVIAAALVAAQSVGVPASPRETDDRSLLSLIAPIELTGLEGAAPVASGTPKDVTERTAEVTQDTAPVWRGCWRHGGEVRIGCETCKQEEAKRSPAPAEPLTNPSTLAGNVNNPGLDFAQAYERAFGWPMKADLDLGDLRYHDHLNAQHRAALQRKDEEIAALVKAAEGDDRDLLGLSLVWIGGDHGDALHDEYLAWYKPTDWPLGEHRAVSAFLSGKFRAKDAQLQQAVEALEGARKELSDIRWSDIYPTPSTDEDAFAGALKWAWKCARYATATVDAALARIKESAP